MRGIRSENNSEIQENLSIDRIKESAGDELPFHLLKPSRGRRGTNGTFSAIFCRRRLARMIAMMCTTPTLRCYVSIRGVKNVWFCGVGRRSRGGWPTHGPVTHPRERH